MRLSAITTEDGPASVVSDAEGGRVDPGEAEALVGVSRAAAAGPLAAADAAGALIAPLRPGKIVAIGLNYLDHIREAGMHPPERPLVFSKFISSIAGPHQDIVIDPALTERVDWEVELAVVIGRPMRAVPAGEALEYVLGYTVANDVSARDVQFADGQWVRAKSFDTFCPIGPAVVRATRSSIPRRCA